MTTIVEVANLATNQKGKVGKVSYAQEKGKMHKCGRAVTWIPRAGYRSDEDFGDDRRFTCPEDNDVHTLD